MRDAVTGPGQTEDQRFPVPPTMLSQSHEPEQSLPEVLEGIRRNLGVLLTGQPLDAASQAETSLSARVALLIRSAVHRDGVARWKRRGSRSPPNLTHHGPGRHLIHFGEEATASVEGHESRNVIDVGELAP